MLEERLLNIISRFVLLETRREKLRWNIWGLEMTVIVYYMYHKLTAASTPTLKVDR